MKPAVAYPPASRATVGSFGIFQDAACIVLAADFLAGFCFAGTGLRLGAATTLGAAFGFAATTLGAAFGFAATALGTAFGFAATTLGAAFGFTGAGAAFGFVGAFFACRFFGAALPVEGAFPKNLSVTS